MKITQDQIACRDALAEKLRAAWNVLDARVDDFNGAVSTAWDRVRVSIEEYDAIVQEARELRDEITNDLEQRIGEKSEKWQESERGKAASGLMDAWGSVQLDEIELDEPDGLETPDAEHAEELEGAPESSE